MDKMEPEFLCVKEVALIFQVTPLTIRRAIKKGWIVAIKIGEGKRSPYRVSRLSIDALHESILKKLADKAKKL